MTVQTGVIEWATESRSLSGDSHCGDSFVVVEVWEGVLVAVVDGLGHGAEAELAANRAINTIKEHNAWSFSTLLQKCHEKLQGTRGVVMSLAFLDSFRTMTWIGIGDVEGRLVHKRIKHAERSESLMLRTGVVGSGRNELRSFYPRGASLERGDILILATDGIKKNFDENVDTSKTPRKIAQEIIQNYSRLDDDALVFVGRYIG